MGYYDEDSEYTDPQRRQLPEPPDPNPTRVAGDPTRTLGDEAALAHLVHVGELLADIRGHVRRMADAAVAAVGVVRWTRLAVIVGGVALGVSGIGSLLLVVGWLLLR